jgi:hypothetical protein
MIWENTKLLLRLYYRPVAAMSAIIDQGHWLYATIVVAALSVLMQFALTSHVYSSYEAVQRQVEEPNVEEFEPVTNNGSIPAPATGQFEFDDADYEGPNVPSVAYDRLPLPLVGNYGWWFVSFAPSSFFTTIIGLALLYVPCLILLTVTSGSLGSFSVVFRRDYGPLLTCTLMAWAAAHLPFVIVGLVLTSLGFGAKTALVLLALSALSFAWLMTFGVRTLFGTTFKKSLSLVFLAAFSFSIQAKLFGLVSVYLFSPFLLYYAYSMFRGDIGDIGFSLRQRQSFRRSMESATINPRDASAHYQLGLVFQSRRQYAEAISRFQQAVAIDKEETDAHFQLGRIAREQGQLQEAIGHFGNVLSLDDKHSRSEVWREVGVTYLSAKMFAEAREALETFVERRPYDPEGLYYYGKAFEHLGDSQQAHEIFQRCIEAVKTMPHYSHGDQRKWSKLARERLSARQPSAA